MDEDTQKTTATIPEEPEKQETVEATEAVEEQESTTQPSSEVAVEKETSKEQVDTPDSDWENEKKSLTGRISKQDKELNEYRQAKKMLDALNTAAANDPDFMRVANKKLVEQGVLDESVLKQLEETASQSPKTAGVVTNPAIQWAQAKMQEEQKKKEEFFVNFEEKHSDLSEGNEKVVRANRSAIGAAAAKRMAEANVPMEDAYDFAYKQIMHPEQLVEEGELKGIARAQSATPVEGAASGGVAKSLGSRELTPAEKDTARAFGLSEEEYAKNLGE